MRRLVRTSSSALPPNADGWRDDVSRPVISTVPVGKTVKVKTFAGVELACTVRGVRHLRDGVAYDVVPESDSKVKDFRAAGVPVDDRTGRDLFVVFEWQILR